MSNYATLKSAIQSAVYTNGNGEITGAGLQAVLLQIVNTVGDGYVFKGVATAGTSAGTPDANVFYIAPAGTYTNFGSSYTVPVGSIGVFVWDGSWSRTTISTSLNFDSQQDTLASYLAKLLTVKLTTLTPDSTENGFFNVDGSVTSSASFTIQKYAVDPNKIYTFSGAHSSSVTIPFLCWVDGNGEFIRLDDPRTNYGSLTYVDRGAVPPQNAAYAWLNVQNSRAIRYNFKELSEVTNDLYDLQAYVYNSKELTPSSVEDDKLFSISGVVSTNSLYKIKKYAVTEGKLYSFSGSHSSSVTIPFVGWADSTDTFIAPADTEVSGVTYNSKGIVAPSRAAYAWMNVPNNNAGVFNFNEVEIGEADPSMKMRGVLPSCNVKDVMQTGTWLLGSGNTYTGTPNGSNFGYLRVSKISGLRVLQEFFAYNGSGYWKRGDQETNWQAVGGGGGGSVTNNYTFNEYQQTVNLTATPTINADTNNYLASTGDTTDRTADILAMLQATGTCHLGAGVFYVDSLIMPDDTSLIGCGSATDVYLADGQNKFAIRMGSRCVVKDFRLAGSQSTPSFSQAGTRTGILWQGDYTATEDTSRQPQYGTIDNLYIKYFDYSGLRCYDTGYGTTNFVAVTNCHIYHCWIGVNIEYWSEFHKFTNVRCAYCQYGCVNNGGNNVFVNCDFSSSRLVAFLIDNSQEQSPNSAHGSCVGCIFNHTASNAGVGIKILKTTNGFVFDGCQIFFSQIEITDSDGITFSSCNFGNVNCNISVTNGGAILFANNMHQAAPTISVINNATTHFVNCYVRSTGAAVTP